MFRPALVVVALLLPGTVCAGDTVPRTAKVSYAGLDLTSDAGKRVLETRLKSAVEKVCAPDNTRDLKQMAARDRCKQTAWPDALTKLEVAVSKASAADQMASLPVAPQP